MNRIPDLFTRAATLLAMLAAGACAGGLAMDGDAPPGRAASDGPRLIASAAPTRILAHDPGEAADAARAIARTTPERIAERGRTRLIEVEAAPYLYGAPEGRRFLATSGPRALVRGAPAQFCPAVAIGSGATREAAAAQALSTCFAQLTARGAPATCGCEALAVDDALLTAPAALIYAPGVSARIEGRGAIPAVPRDLVVRETPDPALPGRTLISLDSLLGPVAAGRLYEDGRAEIAFAREPGRVFTGERRFDGFRRGRMAERVIAQADDGARLDIFIGYEPGELYRAARAAR